VKNHITHITQIGLMGMAFILAGCASSAGLLSLRNQADRAYTQGHLTQAAELYRKLIHAAPDDPLLWARLGNIDALNNHPKSAAQAFEKALRIKPNFAEVRYNFAMLRMKEAQAQLIAAENTPNLPPPLAARIRDLSAVVNGTRFDVPATAPTASAGVSK
jgi:tetratricopeptide (TPR) repeat protein